MTGQASCYTVYDDTPKCNLLYEYLSPRKVAFTMHGGVLIDGRNFRVSRSEYYMGGEVVLWVRS